MYLPACSFATLADKVSVNAVLIHQFGMCALLHNLAVVYDDNLIGSLYGFQPMNNHNDDLFGSERLDGAHQLVFIFGPFSTVTVEGSTFWTVSPSEPRRTSLVPVSTRNRVKGPPAAEPVVATVRL